MDWIQIGVSGLLFIIALIMFANKGQILIAGYNTSSQADKDKCDERKLGKVLGIYLMVSAFMTFLLGAIEWKFFIIVYIVALIFNTAICLWLANSKCKK